MGNELLQKIQTQKTDNKILKEQKLLIKQLSNKTDDAIKQVKDIAAKASTILTPLRSLVVFRGNMEFLEIP